MGTVNSTFIRITHLVQRKEIRRDDDDVLPSVLTMQQQSMYFISYLPLEMCNIMCNK